VETTFLLLTAFLLLLEEDEGRKEMTSSRKLQGAGPNPVIFCAKVLAGGFPGNSSNF
jgi:hypothetical protein